MCRCPAERASWKAERARWHREALHAAGAQLEESVDTVRGLEMLVARARGPNHAAQQLMQDMAEDAAAAASEAGASKAGAGAALEGDTVAAATSGRPGSALWARWHSDQQRRAATSGHGHDVGHGGLDQSRTLVHLAPGEDELAHYYDWLLQIQQQQQQQQQGWFQPEPSPTSEAVVGEAAPASRRGTADH
jgi:hypothetical protein